MSVDEEFYCPPAVDSEGALDADEIFVDPPEVVANVRAVGRQGRPRAPPTEGRFGVWMIEQKIEQGASAASGSTAPFVPGPPRCVVLGLARCCWRWRPFVMGGPPTVARGPGAGGPAQGAAEAGEIIYEFEEIWRFPDEVSVPDDIAPSSFASPLRLSMMCKDIELQPGFTVGDLEDISEDVPFVRALTYTRIAWDALFASALPVGFKCVGVGRRMKWDELVWGQPERRFVIRWRTDSGINQRKRARGGVSEPTEAQEVVGPLLELPPAKRVLGEPASRDQEEGDVQGALGLPDAIRLCDAVSFSLKLRSVWEFSDALDDAHRLNYTGDDAPPPRDRSGDPSRSVIERAKARLDVMGMNINRRIFAEEVASDSIEAISCYSDGSLVVGAELQGMILDFVHRDGSVRKLTLPGSTIHYGKFDAINKTLAFVWSVWLVCGPSLENMEYWFGKVRSFTTDFGTEMHTLSVPWVLPAFMAWIGGRDLEDCRHLVVFDRRLFFRALRVAGWNHCCGNIMKRVAKVAPTWPDILEKVGRLCTFFRNQTWREYLAVRLSSKIAGVEKLLYSFTATVAKWRFETIVHTFRQLARLRYVCQHIREELFANVQDRALLQDVVNACRDTFLWKFIVVTLEHVFNTTEGMRRWGMVCPCHKQERDEGQTHIQCVNNSRRLPEVWDFVQKEAAAMRKLAHDIRLDQCEFSPEIKKLFKPCCVAPPTSS